MCASGIPAQYAEGTLSKSQAQQLILSMFPAQDRTVGTIPAGTQVADPADDPRLLSETEGHYWFQFNTGSGMQDADPLMAGATIGQTFTKTTGTFIPVPANLEETTEVTLTAEIYHQGAASLGIGDGLSDTVVLDQRFDDAQLVGRPLTIGNFVATSSVGAVAFTTTTNTYTPYIEMGDEAYPDPSNDETVTGTSYQEVLTNLPLGSQVLTGLFLNVILNGPQGAPETEERTLFDRIGYAARQGLVPTNVSVNTSGGPALNSFDAFTLNVMASVQNPDVSLPLIAELGQLSNAIQNDMSTNAAPRSANVRSSPSHCHECFEITRW